MITSSASPSTARSRVPSQVWLLWAIAAAAAVQLAPNPLYVTLVVAISVMLVQTHGRDPKLVGAFPVLVGAGIAFAAIRVVLTALTSHGSGDVLFTIPEATLPRILGGFTVGGTIEGPVVAQTASEGWAIVGIIAAFAAFNAVASHHELVQAAPRAFFELGLAVTVAIAFIPATLASIAAVRECDRARTGGHVVRRGRVLRQVVPVLESGMERAVGLAESMDSRGFGRRPAKSEALGAWLGLGALLLLAGCLVALVARATATAAGMAIAGAIALALSVIVVSRATDRIRYRPRPMRASHWALVAIAWIAPLGLSALANTGDETLRWPSGALSLPPLGVLPIALVGVLAITPLLVGTREW